MAILGLSYKSTIRRIVDRQLYYLRQCSKPPNENVMTAESEFQCSDCGADVSAGETVCRHCGAKLEWDTMTTMPEERIENRCPNCGTVALPDQQVCPVCAAALQGATRLSLSPMTLGDIFSRTVQLTGKSFLRYLPVAAIIFIPVSVLFTVAMDGFYSTLGESMRHPDRESIARPAGMFFLAFPLFALAYLAGTVAVTSIVRNEMHGTRLRWQDALGASVSTHLWRALGQLMLVILALGSAFAMTVLFVILVKDSPGSGLIGFIIVMAALATVAYVYIRWSFAIPVIVCEDAGVVESLGRSWGLVRNTWWRVLGIMLLMSILTGFAITIVSAPLSLVAFWDFYREYFKVLQIGGGVPDTEMMSKAFESMGVGVGVTTSVNMILSVLVTPIYTTVLYYDLRARSREFELPRIHSMFAAGNTQPPEPL